MRIAICDDEQYFCDQLKCFLKKASKELTMKFEVEVFNDGEILFERLRQGEQFEVIFLDIILSGNKGTDIAVGIREKLKDQKTQIIFISSSHEYGPEAVEAHPIKYLVKPLKYDEIFKTMKRTIATIAKRETKFSYKSDKVFKCIQLSDVLYFEARNKHIRLVTKDGEDTFYGKISDLEESNFYGFIYIHRSYLINFFHVDAYTRNEVIMRNGDLIRIGTTRKEDVVNCILKMAGEYSADN